MTVDAESMGKRIAAARDRVGMTQVDLASAISLDRSALAKIESGSRRASALELARIAETVGERIEWFVNETPTAIVSHRNMAEPGVASPEIDRVVERVAWNVEFVTKLSSGPPWKSVDTVGRPSSMDEAELAARNSRKLLGADAKEPLFDLASRFAQHGMLSFSFELGPNSADAASILLADGGVAVVNGTLRVGRRRLALAHEFGHYLFADEYTVDWRIAESDEDYAWESRIDRFARALLLPREGLVSYWTNLREGGDSIRMAAVKTASAFRVDMSTLAQRLRELRITSDSEASQVRRCKTTRADIVELNLVTHEELNPPHLVRMYEELVLRLYRQEIISPSRATDLLFDTWNESDLPELPRLSESAIWEFV